MLDISVVQALLGGEFYLAAVFDAFSRAPLALSTYEHKPGASALARLLRTATRTVGSPKYLITDQGREFTGTVFAKTAGQLGIVHRFGSTKNIFATARLERFSRTLKQASSLRLHPPLTIGDLERRLDVALTHYLCFRPHQGLLGATPGEAFLGFPPAFRKAISPPRGRPGEGPPLAPFVIEFLDPKRKDFPFLKAASSTASSSSSRRHSNRARVGLCSRPPNGCTTFASAPARSQSRPRSTAPDRLNCRLRPASNSHCRCTRCARRDHERAPLQPWRGVGGWRGGRSAIVPSSRPS